jgi:hypothetical protein
LTGVVESRQRGNALMHRFRSNAAGQTPAAGVPFLGPKVHARDSLSGRNGMTFLLQRPRLKSVIGIACAYALALQMVLAAIGSAQIVVADPASQVAICYGTQDRGDGPSNTTVDHATCVVCPFVSLAPLLAESASQLGVVLTAASALQPSPCRHPGKGRDHDPRSSQGPPPTV